MKQINIKHSYILPNFIQFKKSFFYRAYLVAASGHLDYFTSFLFFKLFPFLHLEAAIGRVLWKKLFIKFDIFTGNSYVGVSLIKLRVEDCNNFIKRDSNTGVFPWIFLFSNSVFPSVLIFLLKMITKEKI